MQTQKIHRGRFAPGPDPRRHQFTREECQAGFWAALDAIADRYPNAVDGANRHMATRFLCSVISRKNQISREQAKALIRIARKRNQGGPPCE